MRTIRVQFECGHRNELHPDEYGDGSAWCAACGEFQVYERCLTCHSLDCQAIEGPTLRHGAIEYLRAAAGGAEGDTHG